MELRVWVDGVQRIVCGVRLTTTCQEIVFVLAKATHQAGRFTMIERWRNNERLLSPNEQPLVTLQRWGEHMNEVEFILKKASSDIQASNPPQVSQQQQQQQQPQQNRPPQLPNHITQNNNHDNNSQQTQHQQQILGSSSSVSNMRSSPMSPIMQSARNNHQQQFMDSAVAAAAATAPYQYNLNRRPQTSLGPLTSSSSALGIGSINYPQQQQQQQQMQAQKSSALQHPMAMRNSLSTSTLPELPKPIVASNVPNTNVLSSSNARYIEEQLFNSSPSSLCGPPLHNGYPTRSEANVVQHHHFNNNQPSADQQVQQQQQQQQQQQTSNVNHQFEELYSTINKKRIHNPPAIPAKPRVVVPMTNHPSYPSQILQPPTINNAQANFFNGSRNSPSANIFHNNLRPRHPPGYSDYLEAIASRNSSGHSVIPSSAYTSHTANSQPTIPHHSNSHLNNSLNSQQSYNSGLSQTSYIDNRFQDHHIMGDPSSSNYCSSSQDDLDRVTRNSVRSRLGESGLVINLGSAVNVKLPPSNLSNSQTLSHDDLQRSMNLSRSVSEIGHDMLKMIEEQKKVLLNQKDELDRLDNDRDYWETKQNSEQVELVNRIENEIHQLEELWRENQAQISKLENQDLEREVKDLKGEQTRIESEIKQQRTKLSRCEDKITACMVQIGKLESELAGFDDTSTSDDSSSPETNDIEESSEASAIKRNYHNDEPIDPTESTTTTSHTNGTTSSGDRNHVKDSRSSDGEDDLEDDSEGDYSDDLNLATSELKMRAAKDVAYVDKRGLISGIRSLKLDKSKAASMSSKQANFLNNPITDADLDALNLKDDNSTTTNSNNNNNVNNGCLETNGQYSSKTATSSNQYEFLMTL